MTKAACIALIMVALGAAGCGSSGSRSASGSGESTTPGSGGTFTGEGCTSGPADANARVTLYGGETCTQWDQTQSSSGTFWREVSFPPASADEELVCSMTGPKEQTLIEVRDTGEHFYANRICAALTSEGWHNEEGPGAKLEQSRKAHEAEQKAEEEQREAAQRGEEERKRAAEQKKEEARHAAENAHNEAESKKQEAESQRQLEADERKNREDTRRAEEEARRGE